ncbi:MAG: porin, partial [Pseudomonas stutzeri]|nr:porin [Stutzerimonas stutzeri]
MHNKKKTFTKILPLALASAVAMGLSQSAMAEIVLYDQDDTTFSTDGYFNTFY